MEEYSCVLFLGMFFFQFARLVRVMSPPLHHDPHMYKKRYGKNHNCMSYRRDFKVESIAAHINMLP